MNTGKNISKFLASRPNGLYLNQLAELARIPYPTLLQNKVSESFKTPNLDKLSKATGIHRIDIICTEQEILEYFEQKVSDLKSKFPGFLDEVLGRTGGV
jgi:hypothetical protein